jgi:hypothetical protein
MKRRQRGLSEWDLAFMTGEDDDDMDCWVYLRGGRRWA